eukprot:TRINITY_DN1002_c0_g1_i3.p1 TRINITY_DN1002_c0_g1~~TRINITY_DN1002_c0_g1_i3.p1  ORF type:complete len:117 (-),score=25.56 TRINITY_DN1002_c0_g1_i3:358-708(-)
MLSKLLKPHKVSTSIELVPTTEDVDVSASASSDDDLNCLFEQTLPEVTFSLTRTSEKKNSDGVHNTCGISGVVGRLQVWTGPLELDSKMKKEIRFSNHRGPITNCFSICKNQISFP